MERSIQSRIFLVGCPRSGTTLLQSLLASHPRIISFPESHFFHIIRGDKRWRRYLGLASQNAMERLIEYLTALNSADYEVEIKNNMYFAKSYIRTFIKILDQYTLRKGGDIWLEKTPRHLHYIDVIEKNVRSVKFIHMLRNGRDVVASLYDVTHKYPDQWGRPRSLTQCIERWNSDIRISLKYASRKNHLLVRYEDIVKEPENTLIEICNYIGINYNDTMRDRSAVAESDIVRNNEKWKDSFENGIEDRNSIKFNRIFNEKQAEYVDKHIIKLSL